MSFTMEDYLKVAVRNIDKKCPNKRKRYCYRTFVTTCGIDVISKVHLGSYGSDITWNDSPFHRVFDYCEVNKFNPLIESSKQLNK